MFNFFDLNIIPTFLSRFKVNKVLAIGLSNKEIINGVLEYCIDNETSLTVIDSKMNISEFKTEENSEFIESIKYHKDSSLNILPTLKSFDVVFINGDPNWYTVYNELTLIKKINSSFPLVFICNNKYPHKRRDSYFNPEDIPEEFKNECCNDLPINYEEDGEIKQTMIKDGFCHAILGDTPKNGVLTAIEDFLDENSSLKLMEINPIEGVTLIYKPSNIVDIRIKKILEEEIESEYTPGDLSDKFIENKLLLSHVSGINLLKDDLDRVEEFKSEIDEMNTQLKDYERDAQLHDTKLKYKDSQISNVEAQISLKDTQLKNVEAKLVNKEQELKSIEFIIKSKDEEIKNKDEYLEDIENKYKELLEINKKEVDVNKTQLTNVNTKLKNKELELNDKDSQLKTTANRLSNLEKSFLDNKKELENTKKQLANVDAQLKNKDSTIKDKDNQINASRNEINSLKNQLNEKENQLKHKETQLKISETQLQSKNTRFETLKSKFNNQTAKLKNKEHCINCYEEDIRNSNTEIEYLKKSDKVSKKVLIPAAYLYLIAKSKPSEIGTNIKLYKALKSSECFDIGYYLNKYPDIPKSKWCKYFSPELHYVCNGFNEDRKFNKKYYNKKSRKELLEDIRNK